MGEITDLIDKIKRYYVFTPSEIRGILFTILVIAFIISFRDWGIGSEIDITAGLFNFFNAILIATITMLIHESVHRITSLYAGLRAEYKPWTFGLIFGVVLAFLTNGKAWLILPGGIILHHLAAHRIGWWRYDISVVTVGMLALWGTMATMFFAIFLKLLNNIFPSALLEKAILLNIALAIYTILPIPPLNGSKIFYGSRMIYSFSLVFIISTSLLLLLDINPWLSVVSSFILAVIAWVLYYAKIEKNLWQGPFAGMRGR